MITLTLLLVVVPAAAASAAWSSAGAGSAAGAATVMPTGGTPSAGAVGTTVTVSWAASTLPTGAAVEGYVIARDNATNGNPGTVGAGCSGVVTTTTCTELSVPAGSWVYTVTPVLPSWTGGVSAPSATVVVS